MSSSVSMQVMMRAWEEERAKGRGDGSSYGALAGDIFCNPVKLPFHSLHVAASSWTGELGDFLRTQGSFIEN